MPTGSSNEIGGDITFNASVLPDSYFGPSYSVGVGLFTSNGDIYAYITGGFGASAQVPLGNYISFDGIVFSKGIDPAKEFKGFGSLYVVATGVEAGVVKNADGKVIGLLTGFQNKISI